MKRGIRNIYIKLVTFFMIVVMGSYVLNKAIFLHVHILSDGTIITHAHPYNKTADNAPFKHHQHTKAESLFCQGSELLFFVFFIALTLHFFKAKNHFIEYRVTRQALVYIPTSNGRAPPIA